MDGSGDASQLKVASKASIGQVLQNLGWGTGFDLPIANKENKTLIKLLEQKQKQVLLNNCDIEDLDNRIVNIKENINRLCESLDNNQKIMMAKKNQLETEKSMNSSVAKERDKENLKVRMLQKETHEKKSSILKKRMFAERKCKALEELRQLINRDREIIKEFEQNEINDNAYLDLLEKTKLSDETNPQLARDKFSEIGQLVHNATKELDDTTTATKLLHIEFENMCKTFRRLHKERVEAISLWKNSVECMTMKNEEMVALAAEYSEVQKKLTRIGIEIDSKSKLQYYTLREVESLHLRLNVVDRKVATAKITVEVTKETTHQLEVAVENCQNNVYDVSSSVKSTEDELKKLEEEFQSLPQKIAEKQEQLKKVQERYKKYEEETTNSNKATEAIFSLIEEEKNKLLKFTKEVEMHQKHRAQREEQLTALKSQVQTLESSLSRAKFQIKTSKIDNVNMTKELQSKHLYLYRVELEVLEIQSKIHKTHSLRLEMDKEEDIADLSHKKQNLADTVHNKVFLKSQVLQVLSVMRNVKNFIYNSLENNQHLETTSKSIASVVRGTEKFVKLTNGSVNDLKVEQSLLQVNLAKMKKLLHEQQYKGYDLGEQKILLDSSLKEKTAKINVHQKVLTFQKKNLSEFISKLKMKIDDLSSVVENQKCNFRFCVYAFEKTYGYSLENEGVKAMTYFMVKVGQDRQMLMKEGSDWNDKVERAETEIKAMQNTLALMCSSNSTFRDSLFPATSASKVGQQMKILESEQKNTTIRKINLMHRLESAKKLHEARKIQVCDKQSEITHFQDSAREREYELAILMSDLRGQQDKIRRCKLMTAKLIKLLDIRDERAKTAVEKDLKLRALNEKFLYTQKTLERTVSLHPKVMDSVVNFLIKYGLPHVAKRLGYLEMKSPFSSGKSTPTARAKSPYTSPKMKEMEMQLLPPRYGRETAKLCQEVVEHLESEMEQIGRGGKSRSRGLANFGVSIIKTPEELMTSATSFISPEDSREQTSVQSQQRMKTSKKDDGGKKKVNKSEQKQESTDAETDEGKNDRKDKGRKSSKKLKFATEVHDISAKAQAS